MRVLVDVHQPADIEVRVSLRGCQLRVAEKLLNGAKIRAGPQQMRGERMP